ncbi:MAG: hypothetical protein D6679_04525 [Candidatus Hydrogenedentota bacterium]|nr:MAG: hypothetical protein D6679_04525 [Candidatus Hydrogenedentota bacterium]
MGLAVYVVLSRRIEQLVGRLEGVPGEEMTELESRVANFISELTRVANSHANAVEDRREELRRVIDLANERVRRLNSLLSDLEVLERRLRAGMAEWKEGVADEAVRREAGEAIREAKPVGGRDEIVKEVRRLSANGRTAREIAAHMKRPEDEIRLIQRRLMDT